jgi:hypothetical protein
MGRLDRFRDPDCRSEEAGYGWIDEEGISFTDLDGLLGARLGFCGCGMPRKALELVRTALREIKKVTDAHYVQGAWERRDEALAEAGLTTDGARYFLFYMLDDRGLIEHGVSVPGWLTVKGKELLLDLDELFEEHLEEN